MISLQVNGGKKLIHEILVPENWNELSADQFTGIAATLLAPGDELHRKLSLASIVLGLTTKQLSAFDGAVLRYEIFPLLDWMLDEVALTEQLLPVLQAKELVLHGPKSELGNLRLTEWDFAEHCLFAWFEEKSNPEHIARLCATLYRPAKEGYNIHMDPDGDTRQPFNENLVPYYSRVIMEEVPFVTQFAVLLWYRSCRNFVTDSYSFIFGGGNSKSKQSTEPGYFDLMRAIAKEGTYGDFEKVEQMYLYNALNELRCSHEEAERLKSKINKKE